MAQEIIQINKATPVGKRRVCAYTRVSSKSEDQENSLTYQIEAYTKMIMTNPSYDFCWWIIWNHIFSNDWIFFLFGEIRSIHQKCLERIFNDTVFIFVHCSFSPFWP